MELTVAEVAEKLNARAIGNTQHVIRSAQPLDQAGGDDVVFVKDEKNLRKLAGCQAGVVVLTESLYELLKDGQRPPAVLIVDEPEARFLEILSLLHPPPARPSFGVSPRAEVSATATVGSATNVYPGASIADDAVIGEGCDIYPGVYIGRGARIGDHVRLHPNAVVYPETIIGDRVIVHGGAVIGAEGFGYQFNGGRYEAVPHYGRVRIDDDVEIGACTTIDRARVGETVIGQGTKLDDQVMVGHNCRVGRHCVLAGQVGLAGSVTTDDYVVMAGQVGVGDHIHIGQKSVLGAQSGVISDVPEGSSYLGNPARDATKTLKTYAASHKFLELRSQVRKMAARLSELEAQVEHRRNDQDESTKAA